MPEPLHARVAWVAGVVLWSGGLVWVFPTHAAALAGPAVVPAVSLTAAVLAVVLAHPWPLLRLCLGVLLAISAWAWNPASLTSTTHLAGVGVSALAMIALARISTSIARLRIAIVVCLAGGAAMILAGLAGTPRTGKMLDGWLPMPLPSIELGLTGLQAGVVNPNALAAATLVVGPLALIALWLGRSDRSPAGRLVFGVGAVTFALAAVTVVIANSRTAWAALALLLVGFLLRRATPPRIRVTIGALLVVVVAAIAAGVATMGQMDSFDAISRALRSGHDRVGILAQGFEHWRSSPWLGIGLNEFRHVYVPSPSAVPHAHNIVLQTALDVGLIGSLGYWGMLVFLLARSRAVMEAAGPGESVVRTAALGGALTLWAVTLFGLTDAVALGAKVGLFQWLAGGLILGASGLAARGERQTNRGTV